jgi:hypothetical protein
MGRVAIFLSLWRGARREHTRRSVIDAGPPSPFLSFYSIARYNIHSKYKIVNFRKISN